MISKKQIINVIGLVFAAICLVIWPIVLISGACFVVNTIAIILNKFSSSEITIIFITSFSTLIIALLLSKILKK